MAENIGLHRQNNTMILFGGWEHLLSDIGLIVKHLVNFSMEHPDVRPWVISVHLVGNTDTVESVILSINTMEMFIVSYNKNISSTRWDPGIFSLCKLRFSHILAVARSYLMENP